MNTICSLSIVVPVLNEAAEIRCALEPLQRLRLYGVEVIVVDGGSSDTTAKLALPLAERVLTAPRSRARQMNAGAALARGAVILFLHADTRLPASAFEQIEHAIADGALWGRFDVRIEGRLRGLGMVSFFMNWRSRLTGIATGDQGIFATREAFRQAGGYPDLPLMEDVAFSSRMRTIGRPACIRDKVATSGRRWEKHGLWCTIVTMWRLRLSFYFGVDPIKLARVYGYLPNEQ